MKKTLCVASLCLLFLAAPSFAAMISYTNVVNNGGSNYQAGDSGNFTLPQFDSTLGTLTAVVLEITGNAIGGYNWVDNESGSDSGDVDLELGSEIEVTGPASLVVLTLPHEELSGSVTTDTDVAPDFSGTDFLGITSADASDQNSDSPDNFTSYIGTGNVTYDFTSTGNTSFNFHAPLDASDFFSGDGVGIDSENTDFNFVAVVTYWYTEDQQVPEPGTLGLMGILGCIFIPFVRRRCRSRKSA